jgi:hypothetical protein
VTAWLLLGLVLGVLLIGIGLGAWAAYWVMRQIGV